MTKTQTNAHRKLTLAIQNAQECSHNSWNESPRYRAEYRRLRKEAMSDARYWRAQITA